MLRITVDGKTYDYDDSRLLNTEVRQIQKHFGVSVNDFTSMNTANIDVMDAIIWLVRVRNGEHDLKPADLEYDLGTLQIEQVGKDSDESESDDEADPPTISTVSALPVAGIPAAS